MRTLRANRLGLLYAIVARDVMGLYRRSVLGPLWAVIQPLLYLLVFSLIRGALDVSSEGVPYALFTFSTLVPWTFFSNAIVRSAPSVYSNAGIVKKIAVAREVFPAAAVLTSLIDLAISSIVLVGMMVWFRVPVGVSLIWLPLLVGLTALLAFGLGLMMAAFGTYRRDIAFALPFAMQLWMLATPILYPLSSIPEHWQGLYVLNPMVGILEGFRSVLVRGTAPEPSLLMIAVAGVVVVHLLGWPLFRSLSDYFADVL